MEHVSPSPGIYLITDGTAVRRAEWLLETISALVQVNSLAYIQLREQTNDSSITDKALVSFGKKVVSLCHPHGVNVLVNRRLDLAVAMGAAGVHLGSRSIAISDARQLLGKDAIIGYSAHSIEEAVAQAYAGASFVTLSPIFPSSSKEGVPPLGLELLRAAVGEVPAPIYALGGITSEAIPLCMETGVAGVAMLSVVFGSADPLLRMKECAAFFNAGQ